MKLYLEDGEVYFDYSEVDMKAALDNGTTQARRFLLETECGWDKTLRPQVVRMTHDYQEWQSEYGNACRQRYLVGNCYYTALNKSLVEVSDEIKSYMDELDEECARLKEIEWKKTEERERAEKWKSICKKGCKDCEHCVRRGDDFICRDSGVDLETKNVPRFKNGVYQLFNYEPFPTGGCKYEYEQGDN